MPPDPELLAEARRRGIVPQEHDGKDPELLAEARRRGIISEQQPSMGERFMAGLGQRDISQPQGLESGDVAEFVGREGLPVLGSMMGTPLGIGGMAAGAAIGRTVQKGIASYLGERKEETPLQAISDVATTGALQGLFGVGEKAIGMGVKALKPKAIEVGAQLLRAGPGIKEQTGKAVLKDPSILSRAKSVKAAGEIFESTMKKAGVKSGPEATKELTGKLILGSEGKLELLNNALEELAQGTLTAQKGIVARQQTQKLLQSARFGDPALAAEKRELSMAIEQLDDFLEPKIPGYEAARKAYRESKIGEEFLSFLPRNKNLSPNVLRTLSTLGAAGAGVLAGAPGLALLPLAISPAVAGLAIRGASGVAKMAGAFGRTGLPEAAARGGVASLQEIYNRKR